MRPDRRFFVVKGKATHGAITHKCPTAEMALDTLRRFEREAVQNISLSGPDGAVLSAAMLEGLAGRAVPQAPVTADPS